MYWKTDVAVDEHERYRWRQIREAATKCLARLDAQEVVALHLESVPTLRAGRLHPWVWDAAKSAWEAGNYDDAVDAAARNVNSRLRGKVGRRDIGEGDLIAQTFSPRPGDEKNPRLRLPLPESVAEKTYSNIHGGIIEYGKGLFTAVRHPLAHEAPGDVNMDEAEALECLAAFSLLARWIDRAEVHRN
jgi:uncharacterized protein (TIGR02391 family)